MKRILVTGGTGFIGRHLVPLLVHDGFEVHLSIRSPKSLPKEFSKLRLNLHETDLFSQVSRRETIRTARAEGLFHLAWFAKPPEFWTSIENFAWLSASYSLLKEFSEAGGNRAVFAGTCAEYEWQHELYSEETTPLKPGTIYGNCKNILQELIRLNSFGVSAAWARIFFMLGPGDYPNRLIPSLVSSLSSGNVFQCQNPSLVRDFLHVEDVAKMFIHLFKSEYKGAINFGSGLEISIGDLVRKLASDLGKPDLIQFQNAGDSHPKKIVADTKIRRANVLFEPRNILQIPLSELLELT